MKIFRRHLLILMGLALAILFACRLSEPAEENTFTFPGLADSLKQYDSALILLKTPEGIVDTLFKGKVTSQTTLKGLKANGYNGGDALVTIEGYKGGKKVYQVEKAFDGTIDSVKSISPIILPSAVIHIDTVNVKIAAGDSIAFPRVLVSPSNLKNQVLSWSSSDNSILVITVTHWRALKAGKALVVARLSTDTSKWDSLTVEVVDRNQVEGLLDSIRLRPDTLSVAIHGPLKQFKVDIYPDTAPSSVRFGSVDTSIATITLDGWVRGLKAALTRVFAVSKADPSVSDTAWVEVKPTAAITRVHFTLDSLELLEGGAAESLGVEVFPLDLANPIVTLSLVDSGLAQLEGPRVKGIKAGTTSLIAVSAEDATKSDTLRLIILSGVPERPIVSGPSLPVNTTMPTWTWHGGGGGDGRFRYRLDSEDMTGSIETTDTTFTPLINLSEDLHTLVVQERNDSGRWSPSGRFSLRIDTTAPLAPKVSVHPTGITNSPRPTWTWEGGIGDAYRYYRYKLDDNDFKNGVKDTTATSFTPLTSLSDSTHVLYVEERDTAGNWSSAGSASVTIDTQRPNPPSVNVSPASPTNDDTPTWTWTTGGGGAGYRYKLNDSSFVSGAIETGAASFTPSSGLGEGTFVLYLQEKDAAGNWSSTTSKQIRVDLTPPAPPKIDSTPYSPINSLKPKWTWRSGGTGAKVFRCRIDTISLVGAIEITDSNFSPTQDLSEGPHTLYVQEKDSAGNWSATSSRKLTTMLAGYVGDAQFATVPAYATALTFNQVGRPIALYFRSSIGLRQYNGLPGWQAPAGLTDMFGFIGQNPLGQDSLGNPWLTYADENGYLRILRFSSSTWDTIPGLVDSMTNPNGAAICFAPNGSPLIALTSANYFSQPKVYRYNGGASWSEVGTASLPARASGLMEIHAGPDGNPYIAFEDIQNKSNIDVMHFESGKWKDIGTLGTFSAPAGAPFSFAVTSENVPYLIFADESKGYAASLVMYQNSNWLPVSFPVGFEPDAYNVKLAADGKRLWMVFADSKNDNTLTVFERTNGEWRKLHSSGFPSKVSSLSISILDGVPYVGFRETSPAAVSVIKTSFDP